MQSPAPNAVKAELPAKLPGAQLPESVVKAPSSDEWLHEVKYDGYRMLARVDDKNIQLVSRHDVNWTDKFADVLPAIKSLNAKQAILDGEMTVLAPDGTTRFSKLRGSRAAGDLLVFYVFDIMHINGWDLRKCALFDRKEVLADLLKDLAHPDPVQCVEHFTGDGRVVFSNVVELGLEGVVSKQADAPYRSGKHPSWVKTKNKEMLPFVVLGYEIGGSDTGFELLLGFYSDGQLSVAGKSGLGFSNAQLEELRPRLANLHTETCPFKGPRRRRNTVQWVKPELVVQIEQGAWRGAGFLREAVYKGMRDDIDPESVSVD